jgi:N-acetylglutamate synthase-like GNAT family acetyltransferase
MITIRQLDPSEIGRIAEIDRSEHVTTGYVYEDGKLRAKRVDWRVPRWRLEGKEFSVQAHIQTITIVLENGGVMLGAFNEQGVLVGFAVLRHHLADDMAQLDALFVSREYRRQGIATRLTARVARLARESGASKLYVSATPSESAVGFYMSQGFCLADEVHEELYALEPEDIHLIRRLR